MTGHSETHPRDSRAASAAAAERWLAEHGDLLWRFALARTRSAHVAEEMVQETLLAGIEAHARFAGNSAERTWLLGIMAHKIADHFRRVSRGTGRASNGGGTAGRDAPGSEGRTPDGHDDADRECSCEGCRALFTPADMWAKGPGTWGLGTTAGSAGGSGDEAAEKTQRQAELRALRGCLDHLPPGQAEAVWMRDLLGVPSEEVCKAMGLTATNLWTRLHRARSALRTCVEQALGLQEKSS